MLLNNCWLAFVLPDDDSCVALAFLELSEALDEEK